MAEAGIKQLMCQLYMDTFSYIYAIEICHRRLQLLAFSIITLYKKHEISAIIVKI